MRVSRVIVSLNWVVDWDCRLKSSCAVDCNSDFNEDNYVFVLNSSS